MGKLTVSAQDMFTYDELFDMQTRSIAQELAQAVNENSVDKIKTLKAKYADCKEFVKAKKFLDKKCKIIWDVFCGTKLSIPSAAMKSLGITNQPALDFLLGDSIRYFEKTGGQMTVQIIEKILGSKNLDYGMAEIHQYLSKTSEKECIKFNQNTAVYLITKHGYNRQKLSELGINKGEILKCMPILERIKYALND